MDGFGGDDGNAGAARVETIGKIDELEAVDGAIVRRRRRGSWYASFGADRVDGLEDIAAVTSRFICSVDRSNGWLLHWRHGDGGGWVVLFTARRWRIRPLSKLWRCV